jgi:hypothetical protein
MQITIHRIAKLRVAVADTSAGMLHAKLEIRRSDYRGALAPEAIEIDLFFKEAAELNRLILAHADEDTVYHPKKSEPEPLELSPDMDIAPAIG